MTYSDFLVLVCVSPSVCAALPTIFPCPTAIHPPRHGSAMMHTQAPTPPHSRQSQKQSGVSYSLDRLRSKDSCWAEPTQCGRRKKEHANLVSESPAILRSSRQEISAGGWEGQAHGSKEQSARIQSALRSQTALDQRPSSVAQGDRHRRLLLLLSVLCSSKCHRWTPPRGS